MLASVKSVLISGGVKRRKLMHQFLSISSHLSFCFSNNLTNVVRDILYTIRNCYHTLLENSDLISF